MKTHKSSNTENPSDYVLDTDPKMTVGDVLNTTDGVYFCIKNHESRFLWVNENFAALFGLTPDDFIGKIDDQAAHVAHDKEVMASGIPLLNLHETILIPEADGGTSKLEITTQKGLLRKKGGDEIIGITVCFSKRYPNADEESEKLKEQLGMFETGIGGWIAHGPGSDINLLEASLPYRFHGNDRKAYSTNYYLLDEGDVLDLHSLNQDEVWFFHQGSTIQLHIFDKDGNYSTEKVGAYSTEVLEDEPLPRTLFQGVAPANTWFGAELIGPGYGLASCSLAPAWDMKDSFNPTLEDIQMLKEKNPNLTEIIDKLTAR